MKNNSLNVFKIEDFTNIENVIKRYCLYFDSKKPELLIELFTEDATIDYGPEVPIIVGKDKLFKMLENGINNFFLDTSHHVSNFIVESYNSNSAKTVCYLYAWHRYKNKTEVGHLWGGYRHEFVKIDNCWKISKLLLFATGLDNFHRNKMHSINNQLNEI